jgi:hypothetical protein
LTRDDEAGLRRDLVSAIAALSGDRELTVIEAGPAGPATFQVRLDQAGIPRLTESHKAGWDSGDLTSAPAEPGEALVLVNTAPGMLARLDVLLAANPDAPIWAIPGADVWALLADVIADSPIQQSYGLVVARLGDGRVWLSSEPLFPKGAKRGAVAELTVRNECTDEHGTVFAVVSWQESTPRLLSADSARLPPGTHRVRAELRGPGLVRFTDPASLTSDGRSLSELIDSIPYSLNTGHEAHLICAIEVGGEAAQVAARLYCAEKIIKTIAREWPEPAQLKVGVVAYGGHRLERRQTGDPVMVASWRAAPTEAIRALGRLGAADLGYPDAAQVEDMLAAVARRLAPAEVAEQRRTILVVLGDRPPHPPVATGAIPPCPNRLNWEELLHRLVQRPDFTMAAVRDQPSAPGAAAWARLGSSALESLDRLDATALAVRLGLVVPSLRHMPLPVMDADPVPAGQTGTPLS